MQTEANCCERLFLVLSSCFLKLCEGTGHIGKIASIGGVKSS